MRTEKQKTYFSNISSRLNKAALLFCVLGVDKLKQVCYTIRKYERSDQVLTVTEVAKIFNVSRQTILEWINKGIIKAAKPDRRYFIAESEVERLKAGDGIDAKGQ